MPQIKELFFENILFNYKGYACDCVEDLIHPAPGAPAESMYKIQSLTDHPVRSQKRSGTNWRKWSYRGGEYFRQAPRFALERL